MKNDGVSGSGQSEYNKNNLHRETIREDKKKEKTKSRFIKKDGDYKRRSSQSLRTRDIDKLDGGKISNNGIQKQIAERMESGEVVVYVNNRRKTDNKEKIKTVLEKLLRNKDVQADDELRDLIEEQFEALDNKKTLESEILVTSLIKTVGGLREWHHSSEKKYSKITGAICLEYTVKLEKLLENFKWESNGEKLNKLVKDNSEVGKTSKENKETIDSKKTKRTKKLKNESDENENQKTSESDRRKKKTRKKGTSRRTDRNEVRNYTKKTEFIANRRK